MYENLLKDIGLTRGESEVYLALLKLGGSKIGQISKHANISRSKIYDVIEKLKIKGLVSESKRQNIRFFQAAAPERILEYLDERTNELQKKKEIVKENLIALKNIGKNEQTQDVVVYTGYEGVKNFYSTVLDRLQEGDDYLVVTKNNQQWTDKSFAIFFRSLHLKRIEKKLNTKVLFDKKLLPFKRRKDFRDNRYFEMRAIDMSLPSGLVIFKDTVSITTWEKTPRVFVIRCKEVAQEYRRFFFEHWSRAEKM